MGAAMAQDEAPPPPPSGQMQGPPPGGRGMMDPGRGADRMKQELNLTDDQTAQVKAILEDGRTKMEALRSNSSLSQEDRRSQMMSIHEAQQEKIEALLTPDQKTKYQEMQAQMRGRRRGGQGGPPAGDTAPPPPPQN
jgi:Spy/CpxP family protein refolding chaperone